MPETLTRLKEEVAARTRGHSRGWLIGIVIVLMVVIAARIALPYVLRSAINRRLNDIPDYGGHVTSVSVSLYRGAYHLSGLEIVKPQRPGAGSPSSRRRTSISPSPGGSCFMAGS